MFLFHTQYMEEHVQWCTGKTLILITDRLPDWTGKKQQYKNMSNIRMYMCEYLLTEKYKKAHDKVFHFIITYFNTNNIQNKTI